MSKRSLRRLYVQRQFLKAIAVALGMILLPGAVALGTATATLNGSSDWDLTHNPGSGSSPGASTTFTSGISIQGTSSPSITYSGTKTFKPGGTSQGKAGVGRTQSSTVAKLVFPSGIGVGQTDPAPATQSASALRIDFNAIFDITGSGSFGPTINTVFSVPFGAKIGAGGIAQFGCHIEWDKKISGVTSAARSPYDIVDNVAYTNGSNGSGGLFVNGGGSSINVLESFTANTVALNPTLIAGGVGNQLIVHGWLQFAANNDDAPVFSDFPRDPSDVDPGGDPDPYNLFQASKPGEDQILQIIPQAGFEVETLPEPACSMLIALPALLLRRRGRA